MVKTVEFQGKNKIYLTDSLSEYTAYTEKGLIAVPVINDDNRNEDWPFTPYILENTDLSGDDEPDYDYLYRIYMRLSGHPLTILETDRLIIRETTTEDIDDFYRIYEKDPSIKDKISLIFDSPEEEKAYQREYIKTIYEFYNFGLWTMVKKDDSKVIGRIGFTLLPESDSPDLGFLIDPDYRRLGLTFEACEAVLDYAKNELGFSSVQARINPSNIPSVKLFEKLNFHKLRKLRQGYLIMLRTFS